MVDAKPLQCFSGGAAMSATSLGTTFTILSSAGFAGTRIGVVLTAAAMMDDVVGLVMVQVVAGMGGEGFRVASVVRPVGASVGLVVVAVVVGKGCEYLFRGRKVPESLRGFGAVWAMQTAVLVVVVVAAGYAGASVLFGAFIAGMLVTWWDERRDGVESVETGRARITGVLTYERYYEPVVKTILIPFFFASIGFSVPIKRMFAGRIVWRGIVYSVLMLFAKLVTGIWLLVADLPFRAAIKSQKLWSPNAATKKKEKKPVRLTFDTKDDAASKVKLPPTPPGSPRGDTSGDIAVPEGDDITPALAVPTITPSNEDGTPSKEPTSSAEKDNKPAVSLYPALILGLAMVARGEISFLIASIASANGIFTSGGDGGDDDVFVIVVWAAVICTVVGPLGVGLLVRRVKRLEERQKRGAGERGPLGEWSVNVTRDGSTR
ncbi:hypothetical protein TWF696_003071 [Orbilia brochopaga]|uniref:Cation/H+ exchanger transmembrane domain-containing protein n=1 Tax=Orbilia brochopaga TaxID=3140254 RepID=A0AAV9U2N2_9PEZI